MKVQIQKLLAQNYIIVPLEQIFLFSFEELNFLSEFFNIILEETYQEEQEHFKRYIVFRKKPKYLYRL